MSGSIDRRAFLTSGLALLGSSAIAACDRAVTAPDERLTPGDDRRSHVGAWPLSLHIDHSGSIAGRGHAVIGLVATPTPGLHDEALQMLRERGGRYYHRRLSYSSNDRNKLEYAKAVIDHLLETEGLIFEARVIGPGAHGRNGGVLTSYEQLIAEVVGTDAEGSAELKPTTSVGLDPELRDHLAATFGGLEIGGGAPSNLLQLADLLTGSVYGDASRAPRRRGTTPDHPTSHTVKDELIGHLRNRLGVRRLTDRALGDHGTFRVRVWRPPFRGPRAT